MSRKEHESAIDQLSQLLNLTPDAIQIAEGWSLLPETLQRHVKILIDDYVATLVPQLAPLYANTSHPDQQRFNRIVERAQAKRRDFPPAPGE